MASLVFFLPQDINCVPSLHNHIHHLFTLVSLNTTVSVQTAASLRKKRKNHMFEAHPCEKKYYCRCHFRTTVVCENHLQFEHPHHLS